MQNMLSLHPEKASFLIKYGATSEPRARTAPVGACQCQCLRQLSLIQSEFQIFDPGNTELDRYL